MIHETELVTRFVEADMLGHINNTSYFAYLEHARIELLFDLNIVSGLETLSFVVASLHCDFLHELVPREPLLIQTQVSRIGRKSFTLEHRMIKENGQAAAQGQAVMVGFNTKSRTSVPLDAETIRKLQPYVIE